ncbi:MAG TPA: hypothetical protein VGM72_08645 [Micropepsaceae bacterium]
MLAVLSVAAELESGAAVLELEPVLDCVLLVLPSRESILARSWPASAAPDAPTPFMDMEISPLTRLRTPAAIADGAEGQSIFHARGPHGRQGMKCMVYERLRGKNYPARLRASPFMGGRFVAKNGPKLYRAIMSESFCGL